MNKPEVEHLRSIFGIMDQKQKTWIEKLQRETKELQQRIESLNR